MNDCDLDRELDLLAHAEPGTCLELQPGLWLVRGKERSYGVNEKAGTCGCPHFQNRLKPGDKCRHRKMLEEFCSQGSFTCPLCRGERCCSCGEMGRVESDEYAVLLEIKRAQDEARQEALILMFR